MFKSVTSDGPHLRLYAQTSHSSFGQGLEKWTLLREVIEWYRKCKTIRCHVNWQYIFQFNDIYFPAPPNQTMHKTMRWLLMHVNVVFVVVVVLISPQAPIYKKVHMALLFLSNRYVRDETWKPDGPVLTRLIPNLFSQTNVKCRISWTKKKSTVGRIPAANSMYQILGTSCPLSRNL